MPYQISVSYTHLDVYKRQVLIVRGLDQSIVKQCGYIRQQVSRSNSKNCEERAVAEGNAKVYTCLLYTSIAFVQDGDIISIDIDKCQINFKVSEEELAKRKENWTPLEPKVKTCLLYTSRCV